MYSLFGRNKKDEISKDGGKNTRDRSIYDKETGPDAATPEGLAVSSPEDPEALSKLLEDPEVRALMDKEMGRVKPAEGESVQKMFGKGVSTLARSMKKASRGDGDLLDDDEEE